MSLHTLDALDAARAIRDKVLSPVDLVDALLEHITRVDGRVQAWALIDGDGARAAARRAADEATRGFFRGPIHGVPFGAKDIFYSAGLRTEGGSKVMAGFVPDYDATAVARLKAAGAILLGKLHTTEFATTDPAPTRNPWNLACTPGGSSSGSAAAVAARMVPLALGSQTIGSNVRPASYCGLVGLKPTFGRISTRGVMALSYTQDHVGLMARNVEDVALSLSIVAGHDSHDPSSSHAPVPDYLSALTRRLPPRIAVLREFFERATPEVADITMQAVNRLARAGAAVDEAKLPPTFQAVHAAAALITRSDTASLATWSVTNATVAKVLSVTRGPDLVLHLFGHPRRQVLDRLARRLARRHPPALEERPEIVPARAAEADHPLVALDEAAHVCPVNLT